MKLDATQHAQEAEYDFPYHYLPSFDGESVKLYPHWSWGFRYLGGIELVADKLRGMDFGSLVDVGCGDGRLLRELAARFPGRRLVGVDYSRRAIRLASALNEDRDYRAADIVREDLGETFDVVTLIEVLEHIPPDDTDAFLAAVARLMVPGSRLLLTVPHLHSPLIEKHYRHFTADSLRATVTPHFEVQELFFFDRRSRLLSLWQRLMCNKYFIIRHQGITDAFWRHYREHCLACDEADCLRLGAVLRPKASTP